MKTIPDNLVPATDGDLKNPKVMIVYLSTLIYSCPVGISGWLSIPYKKDIS